MGPTSPSLCPCIVVLPYFFVCPSEQAPWLFVAVFSYCFVPVELMLILLARGNPAVRCMLL